MTTIPCPNCRKVVPLVLVQDGICPNCMADIRAPSFTPPPPPTPQVQPDPIEPPPIYDTKLADFQPFSESSPVRPTRRPRKPDYKPAYIAAGVVACLGLSAIIVFSAGGISSPPVNPNNAAVVRREPRASAPNSSPGQRKPPSPLRTPEPPANSLPQRVPAVTAAAPQPQKLPTNSAPSSIPATASTPTSASIDSFGLGDTFADGFLPIDDFTSATVEKPKPLTDRKHRFVSESALQMARDSLAAYARNLENGIVKLLELATKQSAAQIGSLSKSRDPQDRKLLEDWRAVRRAATSGDMKHLIALQPPDQGPGPSNKFFHDYLAGMQNEPEKDALPDLKRFVSKRKWLAEGRDFPYMLGTSKVGHTGQFHPVVGCFQIWDETSMLIGFDPVNPSADFLCIGVPTTSFADDQRISIDHLFVISGTTTYDTPLGQRTVRVVQPVDKTEAVSHLAWP